MAKVPKLELKEISDQTGEKNKSALEKTLSKGTTASKPKKEGQRKSKAQRELEASAIY